MSTKSDVQAAAPLADGRYILLEIMGEGGMATVYRAMDTRLQVARAIKVLSPNLAGRRALRDRFEAEARTMAQFDHPNIVRVVDVGIDGDRVYIVMDLVSGGSLLERVRDFGALPPRLAVDVTIDVLLAVQAAHEHGVVHRDIKPHNVLITDRSKIRVTDFGIARLIEADDNDELTRTGAVMGTWGFMAPEQKENAKAVDFRADLYSVGSTLWAIITNQTPGHLFAADLDPTMMQGIPDPLVDLIKKSTRFRREDRFANAGEMLAAALVVREQLDLPPLDTPPLAARGLRNLAQIAPSSTLAAGPPPSVGTPLHAGVTMVPAGQTPVPEGASASGLQTRPSRASDQLEQAFENVFGQGGAKSDTMTAPPPEGRRWPWSRPKGDGIEVSLDSPAPMHTRTLVALGLLALLVASAGAYGMSVLLKRRDLGEGPILVATVDPPAQIADPPGPVTPPPGPVTPPPDPTPPNSAGTSVESPPTPTTTNPLSTLHKPKVKSAAPVEVAVPALSHTPVSKAHSGQELRFKVRITGSTAYETVALNYRAKGTNQWTHKAMLPDGDGLAYTLTVGGDLASGLEYFIQARSHDTTLPTLSSGTYTAPHVVVIE